MNDQARYRCARGQAGLSLIELMVASLIGLILAGGVIQIYLSGRQSYNVQGALSRMQENGRFAMDLITQDLRRAGYWGGNADVNSIIGIPGRADPQAACPTDNTTWGRMIAWRVHGLNDTSDVYTCVGGNRLRGDVLTVRYASFEPADPPDVDDEDDDSNRLYLRTNLFSGRLITRDTQGNSDNQIDNLGADAPVVLELQARAYYIRTSGATCTATGDPVPGLWRVSLNDQGRPVAVDELAPGVEHLQFRFLEGGQYRDANNVTNWANVSAVRVWLLLRAECPEAEFNNNTEYVMGDVTYQPNDNFRRQLYVSTVMLRNTR